MDRRFQIKDFIFGLVILLLLMYITINWFRERMPSFDRRQSIDSAVLESSVREIGELATLVFSYETVVVVNEQNTASIFGWEFNIPGTARSLIITFDGRIRFGIDMDGIEINIIEHSDDEYDVQVSLPAPTIQTHEIDMDSILILDENTGLFVRFDLEDYTYFISNQKEYVETRTSTQDLILQAKNNAQRSIYVFLRNILSHEYYTISFSWT